MLKSKIARVCLVIFVIEVLLSMKLGTSINIGVNSETNKFSVWETKTETSLQEKIKKDFQTDQYVMENNLPKKILNSETVYNFFNKFTKTPIATFDLMKMLLIVDLLLVFIIVMLRKGVNIIPSKLQVLWETIFLFFENLVEETLGKKYLHFTSYIITIFVFVVMSNLIGVVPIPGFMEPTRNLNVPLGLGIMVIMVVHFMSIKTKGLARYLKAYAEPFVLLLPLNLIGELSKVISISFRLFGNILGGAIITVVVSSLVNYIYLPIGLSGFFGIFVGIIQAFVFTMLSLTYLGAEIKE